MDLSPPSKPGTVVRLLGPVLAAVPLVALPGHLDFSRLPQQALVQVAALGLGLAWLAGGRREPVARSAGSLDLPVLAFLGWSAASLLVSADPAPGLRTLGHWLACALVYLLVSRLARAGDTLRLGAALLLGGAAVALVGLGQALFGLDLVPQAAAPAGTLANRNVAGAYVAALLPLALLPWPGRLARRVAWSAGVAMLAFLPFTRSRAAAVAVAVQLALLVVLGSRDRAPRGARRAALAAAAAALVLGSAAWLTLADAAKARSLTIRAELASRALSMAGARPALGVGLGGFERAHASHGSPVVSALGAPLRVESPHSEPLQVLAETGLPGLLAALWVAAAAALSLRRLHRSAGARARRVGNALALSLAGIAVDAAFGFPLRVGATPLAVAALLGLLSATAQASPGCRPGPRRLLRAAAAATCALVAASAIDSLDRLERDGGRYRLGLVPEAHAQAPSEAQVCAPGLRITRLDGGRLQVEARAVPVAEVLRCLVEKAGLRLEYDGAAPRQSLSVSVEGGSLAETISALLEGLGMNYLLTRDASGADRLIVFSAGPGETPARASARPAGRAPAEEPLPSEPEPDTPLPPFEQHAAPPGFVPPSAVPAPGGELPPDAEFPDPGAGFEETPYPEEPAELTPMTLRILKPRVGPAARGA